MNDPDRNEDGGGGGSHRRSFNWDAVTAGAALVIGVIAILISAYTAYSTRQQTYAQVWPHITVGATGMLPVFMSKSYGVPPDAGGGLAVTNEGVGPAIVRRVEVTVNGKPARDWSRLFKALGYPGGPPKRELSALSGRVFTPGQRIYIFAMIGHKKWLSFEHKMYREVVIRICYCSTLGNCWIDTWKHSLAINKQTKSVGSCAKIPKKDEFNG